MRNTHRPIIVCSNCKPRPLHDTEEHDLPAGDRTKLCSLVNHTAPSFTKRAAKRRVRQNKAPSTGLLSTYSRYLSNNTNTRAFPMPSERMCTTGVLTAFGSVNLVSSGSGPAGLMIPEHPGRSLSAYNGFGYQSNTEWSSYSSLYDEFRVKAIILEYVPISTFISGNDTTFVLLADYDNEVTAGSLTTAQSAVRYTTAKLVNPTQETQMVFLPPKRRAFTDWQSTANTTARGCLYAFFSSATSGLHIGSWVVKYIVTFRTSVG